MTCPGYIVLLWRGSLLPLGREAALNLLARSIRLIGF